ncbi:hypothetical protein DJ69_07525, partial [Halorubrum persicum]
DAARLGVGSGATGETETTSSETGGDGSERPTPTYEDAPIRTTAEDVPGFVPLHSLAALALVLLTASRRLRGR